MAHYQAFPTVFLRLLRSCLYLIGQSNEHYQFDERQKVHKNQLLCHKPQRRYAVEIEQKKFENPRNGSAIGQILYLQETKDFGLFQSIERLVPKIADQTDQDYDLRYHTEDDCGCIISKAGPLKSLIISSGMPIPQSS